MGNYVSYLSPPATAPAKVVLSDGTIREFDEAVTAAELMLDHPNQVVVEYRPVVSAKRTQPLPPPLPADQKLELSKVYIMLPVKRGGGRPSLSEARRVVLMVESILQSQAHPVSSGKFLPALARTCAAVGIGEGMAVETSAVKMMKKEGMVLSERNDKKENDEVEEEKRGFGYNLRRQVPGKGWKPSLDTIEEIKMMEIRKLPHWLF